MIIRLALLLTFALFLLLPTSVAAAECQFILGFNTLRDLIGHEIVGECLEDEHHNSTGDSVQQTTGGLLVWRKADNWTAFTDGYRTWVNGPNGLEQRLNTERFEWEADYAPGGIATPTPTPAPAVLPTPSLIELVKASGWFRDGLDHADIYGTEPAAFRALEKIDRNNPQLAGVISRWAWILDEDMSGKEGSVIGTLAKLDEEVPEFLPHIVELPWIVDGVEYWESSAVYELAEIATFVDLDFAVELANASWVVDGVDLLEARGIRALSSLSGNPERAHSSVEFARQVMSFVIFPPQEADFHFFASLDTMRSTDPSGFERLLNEPWFVDGLDEEERIYLIAARGASVNADQFFEPYTVASASIALPHTGVVHLWAVRHGPIRPGQNILGKMAEAVRGSEEFWELPFPVNNVILYLVDEPGFRGAHLRKMMLIGLYGGELPYMTVYHEVAHYYFNAGPSWFREGGASLIARYLTSGGIIPVVEFPDFCREHGVDNLQTLNEIVNSPVWRSCIYSMGLHFLVALRETMGEEAWLSALRSFYLRFGYEGRYQLAWPGSPDDEDVYRAFMEHTPPHLVDAVRDVFRRLHGGPFVD